MRALLLLSSSSLAAAHMSLVVPFSRNAVDKADPRWSGGKWYPYQPTCAHPKATKPGEPGWNSQIPSGCIPPGTDGWGCNCGNGTGICNVGQSCLWFSQGTTIGCKNATGGPSNPNTKSFCGSTMAATLNDPELRTYNRKAAAGSAADIYKHNPWR